jgi:hypothetical protein
MSVRVVDLFELVDVEHEEGQRLPIVLRAPDFALEPLQKVQPVGYAGQVIGPRAGDARIDKRCVLQGRGEQIRQHRNVFPLLFEREWTTGDHKGAHGSGNPENRGDEVGDYTQLFKGLVG